MPCLNTTRSVVRPKWRSTGRRSRRAHAQAKATITTKRAVEPQNEAIEKAAREGISDPSEQLQLETGFCQLSRPYTPEGIREYCLGTPAEILKTVARGTEVLSRGAAFAVGLLMNKGDEQVKKQARQLRDLLTDLGPSFIKAGQVLANRPDIVRADFMEELCRLQDDVKPAQNSQMMRTLRAELKEENIGNVFDQISEEPVAAASLGQVYRARLKGNKKEVAVKILRPNIEPIIYRDLFLFRLFGKLVNGFAVERLGCNTELIVDEFGTKILEELDFEHELQNIVDFDLNFADDESVKIPECHRKLSTRKVLTMEWIDGIRCTNPREIKESGIDVDEFIRTGVVAGMRQLLEFGLFHGDPHPGNIFAMRDGRIAYVDFGNVALLSQANKQALTEAVVHAVNEDYDGMAEDFIKLGFLSPGTDVSPIVPALEQIWSDARTRSLASFNFRSVTQMFNRLMYQYPIRIPERFSLVIRSLLTQEGICMTLRPDFHFLEVAYPYIAKRLLTDPEPSLRERLIQVLFKDGQLQWHRLENLLMLAQESSSDSRQSLDLTETVVDAIQVVASDSSIRERMLYGVLDASGLDAQRLNRLYQSVQGQVNVQEIIAKLAQRAPSLARKIALSWSNSVLAK